MSKKSKILIVDDDLGITEALQFILEDAGYEVMTMLDTYQLSSLEKQSPNLVLLDILMPGMSGTEVCKYLKAGSRTKHIPVIMVSATRDTQFIAKEAGADDYIVKPFEMDELLTKVAKYISD